MKEPPMDPPPDRQPHPACVGCEHGVPWLCNCEELMEADRCMAADDKRHGLL